MIGVICKDDERNIVEEFFELFKTPWQFYTEGQSYDVILSTKNIPAEINAKIFLIYSSKVIQFDYVESLTICSNFKNVPIRYGNIKLPIYGNILTFIEARQSSILIKCNQDVAGLVISKRNGKILRLGYDLFQEIAYLLSYGQPIQNALIPSLEIHISMIRNWILDAGIPLVEIPPLPKDYKCFICLTHDVDFVNIKDSGFNHTVLGFLYRAIIISFLNLFKGRLSLRKFLLNIKAAFSLPLVHLGICKDFWLQFEKYLDIEKGLRSTYFFIPFKDRIGYKVSVPKSERRAACYEIDNIKNWIMTLLEKGYEIGVHSIDAWHDSKKGCQELNKIAKITGAKELGVRTHWLCFDSHSPKRLEEAGYYYDSTFGYNETVGYRGGTTQVFRPIGVKKLLELPIHIQDTTLFFPGRMGLSEKDALNLCKKLINNISIFGGVLTINWHQRSLAPERLWGDFYLRLLEEIQVYRPWFASAGQIVEWFRKRRSVFFDKVQFTENKLRLSFRSDRIDIQQPLLIRIHRPGIQKLGNKDLSIQMCNYFDISWSGEREIEISI